MASPSRRTSFKSSDVLQIKSPLRRRVALDLKRRGARASTLQLARAKGRGRWSSLNMVRQYLAEEWKLSDGVREWLQNLFDEVSAYPDWTVTRTSGADEPMWPGSAPCLESFVFCNDEGAKIAELQVCCALCTRV